MPVAIPPKAPKEMIRCQIGVRTFHADRYSGGEAASAR